MRVQALSTMAVLMAAACTETTLQHDVGPMDVRTSVLVDAPMFDASTEADAPTPMEDAPARDAPRPDAPRSATLPAWRRAMAPRTWANVGNLPTSVDPERNPALNPNHPGPAPWRNTSGGGTIDRVFNAWSGAAYHQPSDELWVHGGGHDDYAGNEIYKIAMYAEEPRWELVIPPTGALGNEGRLLDGLEASGVYFDGRPRSSHTYDLPVFVGDEFWLAALGSTFASGIGTATTFRFRDGDWQLVQRDQFATGDNAQQGSAAYDASRGRLFFVPSANRTLTYWDVATSTRVDTGIWLNLGRQSRSIVIPELDLLVVLNGSYAAELGVYDHGRTPGMSIHQPGATGEQPSYDGYDADWWYPNGVWIPALGSIACWHGGTDLWLLTPPASNPTTTPWSWSRLRADASNTLDPGVPTATGMFGRVFYSAALHGIGVITRHDRPIAFFALD